MVWERGNGGEQGMNDPYRLADGELDLTFVFFFALWDWVDVERGSVLVRWGLRPRVK